MHKEKETAYVLRQYIAWTTTRNNTKTLKRDRRQREKDRESKTKTKRVRQRALQRRSARQYGTASIWIHAFKDRVTTEKVALKA